MLTRLSAGWMTVTDDRILEILYYETQSTPKSLAEADTINRKRPTVNQRLLKLDEAGVVEKEGRGLYKITEEGRLYLLGLYDVDTGERWVEPPYEEERPFDRIRVKLEQAVGEYL